MWFARKTRILGLTLLLVSGKACAQSMSELFLDAATEDPALASNEAQYRGAQARVREADASLLPSVALAGAASRSKFYPDGGSYIPQTFYHTDQLTLQMTQPIYRPGLAWAVAEAKAQRSAAQIQVDAAEADLFVRLLSAYFEVLTAREEHLAYSRQKTALAEQLAAARRSFELGAAAITDVRDAEAKYDLILAQQSAASDQLALKRYAVKQLIDDEFQLRVVPQEAPDPPAVTDNLDQLCEFAVEQNPIAEQAGMLLKAAGFDVKKAYREHYPTLDLSLSYGTDQTTGTPVNPVPVHGRTGQAQLSFNLPLFAGFGTDAKVQEARAMEDKARADLETARRSVETGVREAYFGLRSAVAQIAALKTAEKSTYSAVLANTRGYQLGANSTSDVLNAQSDYFQAHRDLMKAKIEARLDAVKLRVAMGYPWNEAVDPLDKLLVPENLDEQSLPLAAVGSPMEGSAQTGRSDAARGLSARRAAPRAAVARAARVTGVPR